ncbi:MAG: diphthine--ammonia ligase [Candidatus Omnitrophica bacterium]|nr:diphthine--ammonia ligase [Candidatus Omnitrophota bacterium]
MKTGRKAFCCWSGGKESALSLYRAQQSGYNICCLLNMVSQDGNHSRTHGINPGWLKQQSQLLGIPIIQRKTSWENYEIEFKKVISGFGQSEGLKTGIFGDIDLQLHRDWVERVCKEPGIEPILPLWGEEREKLLNEFLLAGFKTIVVATQADFLDSSWLGREINKEFINDLKAHGGVDLCGEKGEFHTFVYDGPVFKEPIKFITGKRIRKDNHWFLEILP